MDDGGGVRLVKKGKAQPPRPGILQESNELLWLLGLVGLPHRGIRPHPFATRVEVLITTWLTKTGVNGYAVCLKCCEYPHAQPHPSRQWYYLWSTGNKSAKNLIFVSYRSQAIVILWLTQCFEKLSNLAAAASFIRALQMLIFTPSELQIRKNGKKDGPATMAGPSFKNQMYFYGFWVLVGRIDEAH